MAILSALALSLMCWSSIPQLSAAAADTGSTVVSVQADMPGMPDMGACEDACASEAMDDCSVEGTPSPGISATALAPRLTFVYLVPRLTQTNADELVVERFPPSKTLSALCVLRV